MKLSGSYQINLSKQKVWEALNDPEILKKAIPGCEEFKKNSDTEFTATATNKIGPLRYIFSNTLTNVHARVLLTVKLIACTYIHAKSQIVTRKYFFPCKTRSTW